MCKSSLFDAFPLSLFFCRWILSHLRKVNYLTIFFFVLSILFLSSNIKIQFKWLSSNCRFKYQGVTNYSVVCSIHTWAILHLSLSLLLLYYCTTTVPLLTMIALWAVQSSTRTLIHKGGGSHLTETPSNVQRCLTTPAGTSII